MNEDEALSQLVSTDLLTDLPSYQKTTLNTMIASGLSAEQAASAWLGQIGSAQTAGFGGKNDPPILMTNIQAECRKFLCGDPAYTALRAQVAATWAKTKTGVLTAVAAAIGAALGIAAAVIAPALALILRAIGEVGLNAWCRIPPNSQTS